MKKRVTIYVDEKVWLGIRKRALELGKSAGDYLVSMHLAVKVDEVKPGEISDAENRFLNDEYVKEFFMCVKRDKQAEKSKEVIKTVDDIPPTFRSYSKAEQVGKKK